MSEAELMEVWSLMLMTDDLSEMIIALEELDAKANEQE